MTLRRLIAFVFAFALPAVGQSGMLSVTGFNAIVSTPHHPALTPTNSITVEAWFYFSPFGSTGNDYPTIARKNYSGHPYILRTNGANGGSLQWILQTTNGSTVVYSQAPTPVMSWHHVAGTYDGTTARLLLDGAQVASAPLSGSLLTTVSEPLYLGTGPNGPDDAWRGKLDEIRLWSVARSSASVQADMFKRLDNRPGLVSAWHFDGSYADTTGGHGATASGSVTIVTPSTSPVLGAYLEAPTASPIGSSVAFHVFAAPPPMPYLLDVSVTGTTPGVPLPAPLTGVFPLNPPFLNAALGATLPGVFVDFAGITNSMGDASPTLAIPPEPSLAGLTLSSAFFVIDGSQPFGVGTISNATNTIVTGFAPTIASVTPPTGPAAGSWPVTIHGSHFQPGASAAFGSAAASSVVVTSADTITCLTPPGPLGATSVRVTNPDTTTFVLANAFSYVPTLTVTGVAPAVAGAGSIVTISGGGFQTGLQVFVGGVLATTVSVSATTVTLTVPSSPACDSTIVVANPDGQIASIAFNPAPVVNSAVLPFGPAIGGGQFFILGSAFFSGTTVTIGGAPAPVNGFTATSLLVTAPPGPVGPAVVDVSSAAGCHASQSLTYIYY